VSVKFTPLPLAPKEYSRESESLFRRSVEGSLLNVYSELNGAISAQDGESSPASKREMLLGEGPSVDVSSPGGVIYSGSTPYVSGMKRMLTSGISLITITDLLGGEQGQRVTIFHACSGGTTITNGTNILLNGSANLVFSGSVAAYYGNVTLERFGSQWVEVSRMVR
jgi:hypothetical protein